MLPGINPLFQTQSYLKTFVDSKVVPHLLLTLIKRAQDQIQIHKNAKKSNSILFTTYIYTQSSRPDEDSIVGTSRAKIAPIVALFKYQTGRIKAGETRVTSLRHKTKQTAAQSYSIQLLQIRH